MEVFRLAYFINNDCISCGACASECPVSCIAEGKEKYVIDASQCIECGACADVCPVAAPQPEEKSNNSKHCGCGSCDNADDAKKDE